MQIITQLVTQICMEINTKFIGQFFLRKSQADHYIILHGERSEIGKPMRFDYYRKIKCPTVIGIPT